MHGIREKTWILSDDRRELLIYQFSGRGARPSIAPPREVSPKQARRWHEAAERRKLARKIEANFTEDDLFVTLTYAEAPADRQAAETDLSNFLRRARAILKSRGETLHYIRTTGTGEQSGRLHHHVVISGTLARAELNRLWTLGGMDTERMHRDADGTFSTLAEYIMKHGTGRERGKPAYRCSRSLMTPLETVSDDSITAGDFRRLNRAWSDGGEPCLKNELERLYSDWIAVSARAIRNPVTGTLSFSAFLKRSPRSERQRAEPTPKRGEGSHATRALCESSPRVGLFRDHAFFCRGATARPPRLGVQ